MSALAPWLPMPALPSISDLVAALPPTRPQRPADVALGFSLLGLTALALVLPPTRATHLFRAGFGAPLVCWGWLYLAWVPQKANAQERWGMSVMFMQLCMRTLELLIFFPPEKHVYRVRPAPRPPATPADGAQDIHAAPVAMAVREPVPAPMTLARFTWGVSLWCSWRGIGWNFAPPLPPSSRQAPILPDSSVRVYLRARAWHLARVLLIFDAVRLYMLRVDPAFFVGPAGVAPAYAALTLAQKAVYSVAIAARIWVSTEAPHVAMSMLAVGVGAAMGWRGEWWEPWGWPPLFGGLRDLWGHPGLGVMWSRTWQQYNRRVLHVLCWVGIGERVLGLGRSGEPTRPRPAAAAVAAPPDVAVSLASPYLKGSKSAPLSPSTFTPSTSVPFSPSPTPSPSGSSSPANPLPLPPTEEAGAARRAPRPVALHAVNLLKSTIVFTVSGLMHDFGTLALTLDAAARGQRRTWADVLALTPFFAVQPVGLVIEAVAKAGWRRFKRAHAPRSPGAHDAGPALALVERAVGFAWTWIWLGYTAQFFVEGMCRAGVWVDPGPLVSPTARVVFGKWIV